MFKFGSDEEAYKTLANLQDCLRRYPSQVMIHEGSPFQAAITWACERLQKPTSTAQVSSSPLTQPHGSVVQPWVAGLTRMQQAVLFTAIRGPDGISKNHISKKLIRWLRRCILLAAFDNKVYEVPYDPIGANWQSGSFTGPSCYHYFGRQDCTFGGVAHFRADIHSKIHHLTWRDAMYENVSYYLETVDELPHHFQLHFMHAAEILGYKHPKLEIRHWWNGTYHRLVNDMHLQAETEETMDRRLADNEKQWREAEEVVAK